MSQPSFEVGVHGNLLCLTPAYRGNSATPSMPDRFDDVVRIAAPPLETKRTTLELDDSKPQQVRGM